MDIYDGEDPREIGAYTIADAARYLGLPKSTLSTWLRGYRYTDPAGDRRIAEPVIHLPGSEPELSFTNLVEAHVLSSIRRRHGVSFQRVRTAISYVEDALTVPHPLAHQDFETDGVDLFIERFGQLVNVSQTGQMVMRDAFRVYLERIERDEAGMAARLYPFTRADHQQDAPRIVVIDSRISFGRPVVVGTGVPIDVLSERFRAGDSVAHLAKDYRMSREHVEEAIRCELEAA